MSTNIINKNWQLLFYLVGIIFVGGISYATNKNTNADQDRVIKEHSIKLAEDDVREQKDAISDALLKQDVAIIKKDIAITKVDMKELLKEIRKLNRS